VPTHETTASRHEHWLGGAHDGKNLSFDLSNSSIACV
jgi:hypothetical protein